MIPFKLCTVNSKNLLKITVNMCTVNSYSLLRMILERSQSILIHEKKRWNNITQSQAELTQMCRTQWVTVRVCICASISIEMSFILLLLNWLFMYFLQGCRWQRIQLMALSPLYSLQVCITTNTHKWHDSALARWYAHYTMCTNFTRTLWMKIPS
jgi:hypothetical protein